MSKNATTVVIALLLAILIVLGINAMQKPREETLGQRVEATVDEVRTEIDGATAD